MTNKEAIEELELLESGQRYDTEYTDFDCFKLAIEALKKQEKERWIPVSEKMPTKVREYNVSCKSGNREWVTTMAFWSTGVFGNADEGKSVVAWKELPEGYKGEESDGNQ